MQADGTFAGSEANAALVAMLVQAHKWWGMLADGNLDVRTLAKREGVNEGYLTRTLRAAFLAPDVTEAILVGRQHADVSAAALRHPGAIALRWDEQKVKMLPSG